MRSSDRPDEHGPSVADERDHAGERRDHAGDERDAVAERRDHAGDQRDRDGDGRDDIAEMRDQAGERRDRAADARDLAAARSEENLYANEATGQVSGSARTRRDAAADRRHASQDRSAAAGERDRSESDRTMAQGERGAAADERHEAEGDRKKALADRGASATERDHASIDDLTGAYLRGPGLAELVREIARARRTGESLVVAFVDVDGLKATNDARGHAGGDRLLRRVADKLRTMLRPYDRIVRYGGDEFVCAIPGMDLRAVAARFSLVNEALAEGPESGSVTVGLAELKSTDGIDDLIAAADAALYRNRRDRDARS